MRCGTASRRIRLVKVSKIRANILESKQIESGLGYPKLSISSDALKISWAKRIYTSNVDW